ncbi:tRNA 2-thiouridine(34) synthase MnmA [Thermodesulfobacteriota bacterium]
MKPLTAIAVSGGIDSLVAAYLLKNECHEVIGIHFLTGYEALNLDPTKKPVSVSPHAPGVSTAKEETRRSADHISNQLGIRVELLDCSTEFNKTVVDYFTQTYQAGRTPNPCLVCNPRIKFGTVLSFAEKLGASRLATGHYARLNRDGQGRFHLLRGIDKKKDQSYFLAMMTQSKLAGACFPLGDMTKSEVVDLARDKGLHPVKRAESQDICFIKGNRYGEFLSTRSGFEPEPGIIEDVNGDILGEHQGLHLFTIGQRRGINCPAAEPYYVVRIDKTKNRLVVGYKKDLLSSECRIVNINWIIQKPDSPIKVQTRVRYRHIAAPSTLIPVDAGTAVVRFKTPQSALTPGQGAVFYRDDEVLGGGWIDN